SRGKVADEIEVELVMERRVGGACVGPDHEQRVAVRRRAHDRLGADIATRARPVLDHEWLAKPLRQPLTHQTGDDVGRSAWGEWGDDAHRPRWIGLRPSDARNYRQRGGAAARCKNLRRGSFILNLPLTQGRYSITCRFKELALSVVRRRSPGRSQAWRKHLDRRASEGSSKTLLRIRDAWNPRACRSRRRLRLAGCPGPEAQPLPQRRRLEPPQAPRFPTPPGGGIGPPGSGGASGEGKPP